MIKGTRLGRRLCDEAESYSSDPAEEDPNWKFKRQAHFRWTLCGQIAPIYVIQRTHDGDLFTE